jgi:hypothetical protein
LPDFSRLNRISDDARAQRHSNKTETVRNVTIRQLIRDNADSNADVHTVDGIELQLVSFPFYVRACLPFHLC